MDVFILCGPILSKPLGSDQILHFFLALREVSLGRKKGENQKQIISEGDLRTNLWIISCLCWRDFQEKEKSERLSVTEKKDEHKIKRGGWCNNQ